MGQSVSRERPTTTSSSLAPRSRVPDTAQPDASSSQASSEASSLQQPPSTSTKRSRRSSLRHSILGLLPRSHSSGSLSSDSTQPPKKRWRSSRRWSKAPTQLSDLSESAPASSLQSSSVGAPDLPGDNETDALSVHGSPIGELPEEQQPSQDVDVQPEEMVHVSEGEVGGGEVTADDDQVHRGSTEVMDSADDNGSPDTEDAVSQHSDVDVPEEEESQPVHAPAEHTQPTEAAPQQTRQFPPPGTLVVVQGVVNTTDAPSTQPASSSSRPARSNAPRPGSVYNTMPPPSSLRRSASIPSSSGRNRAEERPGGRNRLSAFIPRPSSMLSRRPSSDATRSAPQEASIRNSTTSSDFSPNVAHDAASVAESFAGGQSVGEQDSYSSESDGRPRPLSPGSIDVLGTLLSVAAAATAASLFSPGLAMSAGGANGVPQAFLNRPTSPTPTAALGNFAGLGGLAGLGLHPNNNGVAQAQRDGRDRIRNVWESFRDRLGLNSRNPSYSPFASDGTTEGEARMRPGELMLAEMARALNIGLGLNSDGSTTGAPAYQPGDNVDTSASAAGSVAQPSGPEGGDNSLPPEDSFERFLINLQADLRAALMEDGAAPEDDTSDAALDPHTPNGHEDVDEPSAGTSSLPVPTASADHLEHSIEEDDNDEPPPLADDSDDEGSDFDDDEDEEESTDDDADHAGAQPSRRTPTPIPPAGLPFGVDQRPGAHNVGIEGDRRPPGINLWRLYRFQPIPATQTQVHTASTSLGVSPNPAPDGAETTQLPSSASSVSDPSSDSPSDGTDPTGAPSSPTDPNANVVVPVIVVGLQSVEMGQAQGQAHGAADAAYAPDDMRAARNRADAFDSMPGDGAAHAPRGRTWQSRAAHAFRTLRPGRRGGSRGRPTSEGTGSRTFLIYVIGGYYPPNHHMVTGSDSLDSYEALWELAELLGQVKPPVATKEDIDNSGLQIIQTSELPQYEKDGRVALNCVDRCLICLDDYEPDDNLRLMACKHAFHVDCVDKWLQVGRNNCPACRTKGVSTAGDSSQ